MRMTFTPSKSTDRSVLSSRDPILFDESKESSFDEEKKDEVHRIDFPEGFECPITLKIMKDPVIAADGCSYEREAIEEWFRRGKNISPALGIPLTDLTLKPNINLRKAIQEFLYKQPEEVLRRKKEEELLRSLEKLQKENESIMNFYYGIWQVKDEKGLVGILEKLINDTLAKLEAGRNKELVLVMGNMGAGKSTTINYLLGAKMKQVLKGGDLDYSAECERKDDERATIGRTTFAETVYPAVYAYKNKDEKLAYCDFPGFLGNRGKLISMYEAMSTKIAITQAKYIKAMVVMIDFHTLSGTKGHAFRELIETLNSFLKSTCVENPEMAKSVYFIISKTPSFHTSETLVAYFRRRLNEISDRLKNSAIDRETTEQLTNEAILLKLMCDHPRNVNTIDLFGDKSRRDIIEILRKSKEIKQDNFDFSKYDEKIKPVLELLNAIAIDSTTLFKDSYDLSKKIKEYANNIQVNEWYIKTHEKKVAELKNQTDESYDQCEIERSRINDLQAEIEKEREKINAENRKIIDIYRELDKLKKELNEINSTRQKTDAKSSINRYKKSFEKHFWYNGYPYELQLLSNEKVPPENGVLYVKKDRNSLQYIVINPSGKSVSDRITESELLKEPKLLAAVKKEPLSLDDLKLFLSNLLKITSGRGHTRYNEIPYDHVVKKDSTKGEGWCEEFQDKNKCYYSVTYKGKGHESEVNSAVEIYVEKKYLYKQKISQINSEIKKLEIEMDKSKKVMEVSEKEIKSINGRIKAKEQWKKDAEDSEKQKCKYKNDLDKKIIQLTCENRDYERQIKESVHTINENAKKIKSIIPKLLTAIRISALIKYNSEELKELKDLMNMWKKKCASHIDKEEDLFKEDSLFSKMDAISVPAISKKDDPGLSASIEKGTTFFSLSESPSSRQAGIEKMNEDLKASKQRDQSSAFNWVDDILKIEQPTNIV